MADPVTAWWGVRGHLADRAGRFVTTASESTGARVSRVLLGLPLVPLPRRLLALQRIAQFAIAVGGARFLSGVLTRCSDHSDDARRLAHRLALSTGDITAAARIADHEGGPAWSEVTNQTGLAADRLVAGGDPDGAVALIAATSIHPSLRLRYASALASTGRPAEALGVLEDLEHADAALRFDALWQLGDAGAAEAAARQRVRSHPDSPVSTRQLRTAMSARGLGLDEAYHAVVELTAGAPGASDARTGVALAFDRLDDVIASGQSRGAPPSSRFRVATAHYVQRDFDRSSELLATLRGTTHHWDAEKLRTRIDLERGRYEQVLADRGRASRLLRERDDLAYFAHLHLGEYERAFSTYLLRHDQRRLAATFGDRAETEPFASASSRLVIAQDGPGDEISMSAVYPQLLATTGDVVATCDPRLESILRRSFPAVEFVPTRRQPSRPALGFLAPGEPPRATGNLYDLLSAEAMQRAASVERILLQRSLIRLAPSAAPYSPSLRPDSVRVDATRSRLGPGTTVGVVWRSEFVDAMRSIHFLSPSELGALSRLDGRFVCLQHDASGEERDQLVAALGDRVSFLDDLDLRDDFETMAAVTAACDAVVGVGTTVTELAAAVGTLTVYLHPNLIGAWRRQDGDTDYWHATMRAAVVDDARHRTVCVDRAVEMLRPVLAERSQERNSAPT